MKKSYFAGLVAVFLLVALVGPSTAKAFRSFFVLNSTATATTTVTYMTPGTATTSVYLGSADSNTNANVDSNQIFVLFTGSTSAATLQWQYSFSNGANCLEVPTGCDWFEEDNVLTSNDLNSLGTVEHASTTVTHRWKPGSSTASTSRKTVKLPDVPARYKRVTFTVPAGSTNGAIWVQDAAKSLPGY